MSDLISKSAILDNAWFALYEDEWHMTQTEQVVSVTDIESLPTIDAVPVVRCKDCKWWREETDHTCRKWGGASPRNANGYCDDGERSEE